jgi:hypothetical protein
MAKGYFPLREDWRKLEKEKTQEWMTLSESVSDVPYMIIDVLLSVFISCLLCTIARLLCTVCSFDIRHVLNKAVCIWNYLSSLCISSGRAIPLKHGSCMQSLERSASTTRSTIHKMFLSLDKSVFGLYPRLLCKTKGKRPDYHSRSLHLLADGMSE